MYSSKKSKTFCFNILKVRTCKNERKTLTVMIWQFFIERLSLASSNFSLPEVSQVWGFFCSHQRQACAQVSSFSQSQSPLLGWDESRLLEPGRMNCWLRLSPEPWDSQSLSEGFPLTVNVHIIKIFTGFDTKHSSTFKQSMWAFKPVTFCFYNQCEITYVITCYSTLPNFF